MNLRRSHSFGLFLALSAAAAAPLLTNCAAPSSEAPSKATHDEGVTGVRNAMGLALRYDARTGRVDATLTSPLAAGERLYVRARRGKITRTSQQDLSCDELTVATPLRGDGTRERGTQKVVYEGPVVEKSVLDAVHLFDDPRWANGTVTQAQLDEVKKGPDPIVEACIVKDGVVRAKLQTTLAYASDQAARDAKAATGQRTRRAGSHAVRADGEETGEVDDAGPGLDGDVDAGVDTDAQVDTSTDAGTETDATIDSTADATTPADGDGGASTPARLVESDRYESQTAYAELCVQELGDIPFFPKLADGSYGTFDCRDYTSTAGTAAPVRLPGVEGAGIPITNAGTPITDCDGDDKLGPDDESYNCVKKCDQGMFLSAGACQPGPSIATAKNAEGTHWVLLCRKVSDDGRGMMQSKMFNDIAMIGHNPKTGRTCFFQNSIGSGRDGEHVTHPADKEKSTQIWSPYIQTYCSGSCHAADPFVHSKWIDRAKRSNGKAIIPMMGEDPDFAISYLESPYNIVAADTAGSGFSLPKQLVSEDVGACANCHRLAGNTAGSFAEWATGTGDAYFSKITDFGKRFEESHWMPLRLEGYTAATWKTSKYGVAMDLIKTCDSNPSDPRCEWAEIPRGLFNNPSRSE